MQPLVAEQAVKGYLQAVDASGKSYYFGDCGALSGVTCQGTSGSGVPIAIQVYGSGQPPVIPSGSCATLGSAATARNCSLVTGPTKSASMLCKYSGGSRPGTTLDVRYACEPGVPVPHFAAAQQGTTLAYTITVTGAAMCGAVYTPPLSWGSVFDILLFVGLFAYAAGGFALNVKVRERRPTLEDAFPHWEHWRELPDLLRDGASFAYEQALKAYYKARHQAAPLDPSLSRRLASDDGGAGPAT